MKDAKASKKNKRMLMYLMEVIGILVSPYIILPTISLFEEVPIHVPIKELRVKDVDAMKFTETNVLLITVKAGPLLIASI